MWLRRYSRFLRAPRYIILRCHYSDSKSPPKLTTPAHFTSQVARLLGIDWTACRAIISEHRKIASVKYEDIEESVRMLESFNYSKQDICRHPMLLHTSAVTLQNRYTVLQECGCVKMTIESLDRFIIMMNREIRIIKLHGIIPEETNVLQQLVDSFLDVRLKVDAKPDDNQLLRVARECVLNAYLKEKLGMNQAQLDKFWYSYKRIRHKSYKSISEMIEILTKELNFSNERIIKNGFVLYADPDNVRRFFEKVKQIGDEDIREILYRRPKIMMTSCDGVKKSIEHITAFGVKENSINKCLDILTLGSDTVLERLKDLDTIEELRALKSNPRILRLVHYQNKARMRLDYLNQLKVKCASLHVLSAHANVFVRYTQDGADKGKGCDTINYLANVLKRTPLEVRDMISRHPNWCHVPTMTVTQSYEFLVSKLFNSEDIFPNLQILLYPIKRINEKLIYLQNDKAYEDLKLPNNNYTTVTNRQTLALCLYLIELEYHFTGDGIWTEQDLHPVENFNSILPDFPDSWKKGYKYGTRPTLLNKVGGQDEVHANV
ncbi:unnamed protein product [Hermetia illucens]|uniref:Uncharacterized protein n=2 Tax=Hermetia illucens TaxID=343691 RepID=A0A7R8V580_HERIL|nr:unnamed protein product [Hermetia illucens]